MTRRISANDILNFAINQNWNTICVFKIRSKIRRSQLLFNITITYFKFFPFSWTCILSLVNSIEESAIAPLKILWAELEYNLFTFLTSILMKFRSKENTKITATEERFLIYGYFFYYNTGQPRRWTTFRFTRFGKK